MKGHVQLRGGPALWHWRATTGCSRHVWGIPPKVPKVAHLTGRPQQVYVLGKSNAELGYRKQRAASSGQRVAWRTVVDLPHTGVVYVHGVAALRADRLRQLRAAGGGMRFGG